MKASLLFYKPFIIPFGTRVKVSRDGGPAEEVHFGGYRNESGVTRRITDLYPFFKKAKADGTMSQSVADINPSFFNSGNYDIMLEPEAVEKLLLRKVVEEFDIFVPHTGTLHKYVGPVCYAENGENRMIEDLSVRYGTGKEPVLSVSISRTGPNIEAPARNLPQDVQERLVEALYDTGEGKRQNAAEFEKIIHTQP